MQSDVPDAPDPVLATLRARGARLTPQRLFVLEALQHEMGHHTAEEIYQRVAARYPYINRATVYRTLAWLTDQGLTSVTDLGHGQDEYEYLAGEHHHHLICLHCGKQERFTDDLVAPLTESLATRYGFAARLDHLAVFGYCRDCQHAAETPPPVPDAPAD